MTPSGRTLGPKGRYLLAAWWAVLSWTTLFAEVISVPVPNGSFEYPATTYVSTNLVSWQRTPKPDDYDDSGEFYWHYLTGVFANTAPGASDHITNCDGAQALWLWTNPEVGLYLDGTEPGGEFPVTYVPGDELTLTVGVLGGSRGMRIGASLRLELYYLNGSEQRNPVATTEVVFTLETFPSNTRFYDFQVKVPAVKPTDPWAGKRLGIKLLSTVTPESNLASWYWDIDNVRLTIDREASFVLNIEPSDGGVRIRWFGMPGVRYQVQSSPDLRSWSDSSAPLDGTGSELSKVYPENVSHDPFRRVVTIPGP